MNEEHLSNSEYEILTEEGFKDFDGISIKVAECFLVSCEAGILKCTADHRIMLSENKFVECCNLIIGDHVKYMGRIIAIESIGEHAVYDPINVSTTSSYFSNGAVSHNCSMIYIDECAFVQHWEAFSTSVLPTMSSGKTTKMIFTSTPKGLNHFYEYCTGAQKNKNGYKYFEIPWWKVPGRDEKWKERVLQELNNDETKFAQEYNCEFLGSSATLISTSKLKQLEWLQPKIENDDLKIYTDKLQYHSESVNFLVADVSHGKGLDYHAFSVFDVSKEPYQQIASFRNNTLSPIEYAEVIHRTAQLFDAYVLVELNDMGHKVAHVLYYDLECEKLIRTLPRGRMGQVPCLHGAKSEMGVKTTRATKSVGCSMLKSMVERNLLNIVDQQTIQELFTFVRSDKVTETYAAEEGRNDDTITSLFLFAWLATSDLFRSLLDINTRKVLSSAAADEINSLLNPLVYVTRGEPPEKELHRFEGDDDVWEMGSIPPRH